MTLTEGQVSDYKGVALLMDALPEARELMVDRGYDTPWDMPGYEDKVVMASGAFIQGSSIELSADAPVREPFNVYFQGGLTYEHGKLGIMSALNRLKENDLLRGEL